MLKKVLKYVGLTLAILTGLPLVVAPLLFKSRIAYTTSETEFGLFDDLEGMEFLVKDFNPFWIHAIQVMVVISFALACVMLVIALLNDFKVLKLQKVEKLLATVLMTIGLLALICVTVNQFVNSHYETDEFLDMTTGSGLVANVLGWLFPFFAMIGAGLIYVTVESKKQTKKRK